MKAKKKVSNYSISDVSSKVKEPEAAYITAVAYLGGRLSGLRAVKKEEDFIQMIKKGVPKKSLDQLMTNTGLSANEIALIMHTSDRTLRRYKPGKLLNTEQSERVIELARLYSRGEEVFESLDAFKEWIDSTVMALGNKRPKEFLDTSLGIELLMDELGRIEQGIFA